MEVIKRQLREVFIPPPLPLFTLDMNQGEAGGGGDKTIVCERICCYEPISCGRISWRLPGSMYCPPLWPVTCLSEYRKVFPKLCICIRIISDLFILTEVGYPSKIAGSPAHIAGYSAHISEHFLGPAGYWQNDRMSAHP